MRKYRTIVFLFLLGIFFIPKFVLAEDLPREGVHYFLTYPNGEQVVTTNYEEASDPKEKLIYTGRTNDNGEIVLEGYSQVGELRIVQKVPTGYSTERREIILDLSQTNRTVEFVDFKGTLNPETGQSLILIGMTAVVLSVLAMIIVKSTNKKMIFLIPACLLGIVAFRVYASSDDIVISVRDRDGKKIPGVEVEVYAIPSRIEATPAITFSANGGHFFDGKTEMIFKLPSSNCTFDEFGNSLSSVERDYLFHNLNKVYRQGYFFAGLTEVSSFIDGAVISVVWEEDNQVPFVQYHGNGGFYDFYGTGLTDFALYEVDPNIRFERNGYYFLGYDDNASCSHFTEYGIATRSQNMIFDESSDLYACWNANPDGIYVDDEYFDSSFGCGLEFFNINNRLVFVSKQGQFYFYKLDKKVNSALNKDDVHALRIIKNGELIVSVDDNDLSSVDGNYYIENGDKYNAVLEYLNTTVKSCQAQ